MILFSWDKEGKKKLWKLYEKPLISLSRPNQFVYPFTEEDREVITEVKNKSRNFSISTLESR
jgi:hypothetical protein